MSAKMAARAQTVRLARLLGVAPEEIAFLDAVAPETIAELREAVAESLFADPSGVLGRIAAASRLLPVGVVAAIAENAFGPVLAARLAGLLDPQRAAEVADRLSTPFLADTALHLDPRRVPDLLARMTAERIAAAADELAALEEYVTLALFVPHIPDGALADALASLDELAILRAGLLLEDLSLIDRVLRRLPTERRARLAAAARSSEMWPDIRELLEHVDEPLRSQLLAEAEAA
jgi:hypothetical protein